jgi:hypothetical protein
MQPFPDIRYLERTHGVTWHELVELEPRLAQLLWESRQACVSCCRRSDVDRIFIPIRNSLAELLGFSRRHHWHPVLASLGAYEVAYCKLYTAVAASLPGRANGSADTVRNSATHKIPDNSTYPAHVCVTDFQI